MLLNEAKLRASVLGWPSPKYSSGCRDLAFRGQEDESARLETETGGSRADNQLNAYL